MKEEKKKLSTESNLGSLTLRGNRAWGEHCSSCIPRKKSGANLSSQLVKGSQSYRSRLPSGNEKKTAVSQDWRNKGKNLISKF